MASALDLVAAAEDDKWDAPIVEAMEVAYAFGGPKTQTPTIVVRADPPYGFKGPVMAPAPTGEAAVALVGRHRGDRSRARVLRDHPATRQPTGDARPRLTLGAAAPPTSPQRSTSVQAGSADAEHPRGAADRDGDDQGDDEGIDGLGVHDEGRTHECAARTWPPP